VRAKPICLCGFEIRFGEPPKQVAAATASRIAIPKNKMPDVDSYDSSSGIAVDVQQRLNCALP